MVGGWWLVVMWVVGWVVVGSYVGGGGVCVLRTLGVVGYYNFPGVLTKFNLLKKF